MRTISVRHSRYTRANLALVGLAAWMATSACHKWVPLDMPFEPSARSADDREWRVMTFDGRELHFESAVQVTADSLIGCATEDPKAESDCRRLAIARSDIEAVEEKRPNGGATALLVGGSVLAAAALYVTILLISVLPAD